MTTPDNFKEIKYPSMLTTYIKEPKMYWTYYLAKMYGAADFALIVLVP